MKVNYFINAQLIALNEEYKTLTTQQRMTGASFFNRVLRPAHTKYSDATSTNCGFFKSHIPCTKEYEIRSDCAAVMETARNTIQTLRG